MIKEVFGYPLDDENKLYYIKTLNNWNCLFLDTSSSTITKKQIDLLKRLDESSIIFTHYPLITGRVKHMDKKYPFNDTDKIMSAFKNINFPLNIFCGHYHVEKTITHGNINMFLTPSTFFQIKQDSEMFSIDHKLPGWRVIELVENTIYTSTRYVNNSTTPSV